MGKGIIEDRGRVLIPKKIREQLNLRPGQHVIIEKKEDSILIRPSVDVKKFSDELKGCVKKSMISPKDIKNIWHM